MVILTLRIPEPVAAEYTEAAKEINRTFGELNPKVDAKSLMIFALSRHQQSDICAQFDLALRVVSGKEPRLNPLLD
ncbi:MAG: hypothetical protein HYV75_07455 [Opitutae bacterium]|jgi:hypothetical protein|nr:hypothetical protein [Opitutae bacterium]